MHSLIPMQLYKFPSMGSIKIYLILLNCVFVFIYVHLSLKGDAVPLHTPRRFGLLWISPYPRPERPKNAQVALAACDLPICGKKWCLQGDFSRLSAMVFGLGTEFWVRQIPRSRHLRLKSSRCLCLVTVTAAPSLAFAGASVLSIKCAAKEVNWILENENVSFLQLNSARWCLKSI